MNKIKFAQFLLAAVLVLTLSACNIAGMPQVVMGRLAASTTSNTPEQTDQPNSALTVSTASQSDLLAAYDGTLERIYNQVNPSVVSIRVVEKQSVSLSDPNQNPFFAFPFSQSNPGTPQYQQGLGSGFVWDKQGHIVTNNHVVDGADKIEVTFIDGTIVSARLIGKDPYSDLAVIQVDVPASQLAPVQLAGSSELKVGELAIAIGNPFGEQGTMTTGIISALGRSINSTESQALGPSYSIPDIIQTDAPINPGNSGGVLLNDQGQVIGVTAAIESPVQASSGIGFAIPSSIVQKVVPVLIKKGKYEHPYLGISGTTLTPDLAKAMKLQEGTRGALVGEVTPGGPAEAAGLRGSDRQVTIDGQDYLVGGDVIVGIEDQPVKTMDEIISYLYSKTEVGQSIKLSGLRNGKTSQLTVKLAARPEPNSVENQSSTGSAWLGIRGISLTPSIAKAVSLSPNTKGVLVEQIEVNSPADKAGLVGSTKPLTIAGERILIGGDVITALNGHAISSVEDLAGFLSQAAPGDQVTLTILRDGKSLKVSVTLDSSGTQ